MSPELAGGVEFSGRGKLYPRDFLLEAEERLDGTNLLDAFKRIQLETAEDGSIAEHVVQNIKSFLIKAIEMTPDDEAKDKFDRMLKFLADYE